MSLWRNKSDEIVGFLDHGTEVTGELQFSNTLRIDGNFHGSIVSEDRLIVGEQAVVHADIKVGDIEIWGQVFGNVVVKGQAEILSTALLCRGPADVQPLADDIRVVWLSARGET